MLGLGFCHALVVATTTTRESLGNHLGTIFHDANNHKGCSLVLNAFKKCREVGELIKTTNFVETNLKLENRLDVLDIRGPRIGQQQII